MAACSPSCSIKKWHASLGLWDPPGREKRMLSVGVPSHKSINFSLSSGQLEEDDIHGFVLPLSSFWSVVFTDHELLHIYKDACLWDVPHPIWWCRTKGHIGARNRGTRAAQFCTLSPSLLSSYYWCLGTQGGNQDETVGCSLLGDTKGVESTGDKEGHVMISKVLLLLMKLCHEHCTVLSLCFI